MHITIETNGKRQVIDITDCVSSHIPASLTGLATITVLHSTAAVTTANLDPGTDLDLIDALAELIPKRAWRHPHNPSHAPDHLLSSIIGPSISLPVIKGRLMLGIWQRLALVEFNGPRSRDLALSLISGE